jgi:hypothetical protein
MFELRTLIEPNFSLHLVIQITNYFFWAAFYLTSNPSMGI